MKTPQDVNSSPTADHGLPQTLSQQTKGLALSLSWAIGLCLVCSGPAQSADLSMVADFDQTDITRTAATILQAGDGPRARIDQILDGGTGNTAQIIQIDGMGNEAYIVQTGDLNAARVEQSGDLNLAQLSQTGVGNRIDLLQVGGSQAVLTQIGDSNTILVQQGADTRVFLIQNGNSLIATARQQ